MKKTLLFILVVWLAFPASAQRFAGNIEFVSQFDNREYGLSPHNPSQTLFGFRALPEVGVEWARNNFLMAGVTVWQEYGARSFDRNPEFVMYYNWRGERHNVSTGIFPRNQTMGRYSTAFFSDSVKMYDSNLSGFLGQIWGEKGYFEFAFDWDGRQSKTRREKFTIFSSGEYHHNWLLVGYNLSMHHHAKTEGGEDGVTDNIWLYPYVGINLQECTNFQQLYIRGGWLQTAQNDRTNVGRYVTPGGAQVEAVIQRWNFGIDNTLYLGKSLMPYYDRFGSGLYWGDSFYRTTKGVYDRLELYWEPLIHRNISLRVSSVHHYDGLDWGWQQFVSFRVNLGTRNLYY